MIIAGSIIPILLIFIILYVMMPDPQPDPQSDSIKSESDSTIADTTFDEMTLELDGYLLAALETIGIQKSSVDTLVKTASPDSTKDETDRIKRLLIVRKVYLKHFVPIEVANLEVMNRAEEHGLDLEDALEIRNSKDHYVRIWFRRDGWFGRDSVHTNTILLYPGAPPAPIVRPSPTASKKKSQRSRAVDNPSRPKLGIVIDDFGVAFSQLTKDFIDLPYNLTFSILPPNDGTYKASPKIAKAAYDKKKEVILHLPMEPKTYPSDYPGPGAIYVDDSPEIKKQLIQAHIKQLTPYLKGVNNHMGSRATMDENTMQILMEILKDKGLYFVDSKTSRESIGAKLAAQNNVRCRENWFFIDPGGANEEYIKKKLQEAADIARERGSIVVIGHISRTTYNALESKLPDLKKQGIEMVPVSQILH